MNEKEIQRRIFRITVLTVAVSLILIVCAGVVITSMLRAEKNSYEAQMKAFINEYKINMERQILTLNLWKRWPALSPTAVCWSSKTWRTELTGQGRQRCFCGWATVRREATRYASA